MMDEHGGDFLDASFIANTKMFHFARALVEHIVNVVLSPNFHEGEMQQTSTFNQNKQTLLAIIYLVNAYQGILALIACLTPNYKVV